MTMEHHAQDHAPGPGQAEVVPHGTIIYTLEGALPVEYLEAGDRIVTRAGARILRGLERRRGGFRLRFDGGAVIYADGALLAVS